MIYSIWTAWIISAQVSLTSRVISVNQPAIFFLNYEIMIEKCHKPQNILRPTCDHYYLSNLKFNHSTHRNICTPKQTKQNKPQLTTTTTKIKHLGLFSRLFLSNWKTPIHQSVACGTREHSFINKTTSNGRGGIQRKLLALRVLGWGHVFLFQYLIGHKL